MNKKDRRMTFVRGADRSRLKEVFLNKNTMGEKLF